MADLREAIEQWRKLGLDPDRRYDRYLIHLCAVAEAALKLDEYHDDGLSVEGPDFWGAFNALHRAMEGSSDG